MLFSNIELPRPGRREYQRCRLRNEMNLCTLEISSLIYISQKMYHVRRNDLTKYHRSELSTSRRLPPIQNRAGMARLNWMNRREHSAPRAIVLLGYQHHRTMAVSSEDVADHRSCIYMWDDLTQGPCLPCQGSRLQLHLGNTRAG